MAAEEILEGDAHLWSRRSRLKEQRRDLLAARVVIAVHGALGSTIARSRPLAETGVARDAWAFALIAPARDPGGC